MYNLLSMSNLVTINVNPSKGYQIVQASSSFATLSNTVQGIELSSGTGAPSISIDEKGRITGNVNGSVTPTDYILNAPLVYVNNISGVSVTVVDSVAGHSNIVPNARNALFVRKTNGSYGVLSATIQAITNTITSVI